MSTQNPQDPIKITEKDKLLLDLLQNNARESNASLARKIGISRATVQERINRLENAGVIEGYSANINHKKLNSSIDAIVMMLVENKLFEETFLELEAMQYIQIVRSLSGEWDWAVYISAPNIELFHQSITDINKLIGVKSTVSHIITNTRLDRRYNIKVGY